MRIGNTDIASMKLGSTDINKVFKGTSLVWQRSSYEAETIAYRDRVEADGGVVIDIDYVDKVFKKLKELNLLSSLKHWSSARAGIKKDSSGYISELYSLGGLDIEQVTGAAQPQHGADFNNYDGNDFLDCGFSPDFSANGFSAGSWFNTTTTATWRLLQNRGTGSAGSFPGFQISIEGSNSTYQNTVVDSGEGNYLWFDSVPFNEGDGLDHYIYVTFDSVTGTANLFIDGELTATRQSDLMKNVNVTSNRNLTLACAWDSSTSQTQFYTGKIGDSSVWDKPLTQTEIQAIAQL